MYRDHGRHLPAHAESKDLVLVTEPSNNLNIFFLSAIKGLFHTAGIHKSPLLPADKIIESVPHQEKENCFQLQWSNIKNISNGLFRFQQRKKNCLSFYSSLTSFIKYVLKQINSTEAEYIHNVTS